MKRSLVLVSLGVLLAAAFLAWREGLLFAPEAPTRPAERLQEQLRRPEPPESPAPPVEQPPAPKGEPGVSPSLPEGPGGTPSPARRADEAEPTRRAEEPFVFPPAPIRAGLLESPPVPEERAPVSGPDGGGVAAPPDVLPPPLAQLRPVVPAPPAPMAEAAQPTPGGKERRAPSAGPAPFSLQISSFEVPGYALKETRRLRAAGYRAFTLPIVSPEGLKVRRVYLGRYRTAAEARAAGATLMARGILDDFAVDRLPFAIELAPPDEPEVARALREKCEGLGYLPEEVGKGKSRRWLLHAFRTRREADAVAADLAPLGAAPAVVER